MTRTIIAAMLLAVAAMGAHADEFTGRTGLPSLKGAIVKLTDAAVRMNVDSNSVATVQSFKIEVGGKEPKDIEVTWREDAFKSEGLKPANAKGFRQSRLMVDGTAVKPQTSEWQTNSKGDTVTRRHTLRMLVKPGSKHQLVFSTSAPLGKKGNRKAVEFVAKDLGGFAGPPNRLEIRLDLPKNTAAKVDGVEPKPTDISRNGMRWVWNKARASRDLFILLPVGFGK